MKKVILGLMVMLLVVSGTALGCPPPRPRIVEPPAPPGPAVAPASIVIVPMSGTAGTRVTVYGAGFVPGEKVKVILHLPGLQMRWWDHGAGVEWAVANEQGAFALRPSGGIPRLGADLMPAGVYTVEARGDKGSWATVPLEVLEKK